MLWPYIRGSAAQPIRKIAVRRHANLVHAAVRAWSKDPL